MEKKRRIAVILGSESDFAQCPAGLELLQDACNSGQAEVVEVNTMSIHRNHDALIDHVRLLHENNEIEVIIAGAGWAAHLPGMLGAYLGYMLNDRKISVIGVGFKDPDNERHTLAAELSISEVPGTPVIYRDDDGHFIGASGFLRACQYAVSGKLPVLKAMQPQPTVLRDLEMAIEFARAKAAAKLAPS